MKNLKDSSPQATLLRTAAQRLHPSIREPNFLVLRSRRLIFTKWISELPGENWAVLDIGGRYQPYRPLVEDRTNVYIGVDVIQTGMVDVVASGESLPFLPNTFDVVIATQVFDCFSLPERAAQQIHVALKPGGCLLASVPGFAPRFVDDEKWRFTSTGLRSLLSPFSRVEILPELSNLGSFLRVINLAMNAFLPWKSVRWLYNATICPGINLVGMALEAFIPTNSDQFATNYSVLARKSK